MLAESDVGFLFHAHENVRQRFPQFRAVEGYDTLLSLMKREIA